MEYTPEQYTQATWLGFEAMHNGTNVVVIPETPDSPTD